MIKLSTYLIPYRVGDIVDIKANAAQQKGMPHKYYQGCVTYSPLHVFIAHPRSMPLPAALVSSTTSHHTPSASSSTRSWATVTSRSA
jgi:hypothetical protein